MAIENGDFVRIEFTGKIKETGDVFDTTNEEVAKESGVFIQNKLYVPLPVIVGGNHLLKALESDIIGMEEGESKKVNVSPEEGYGERDPKKIQLIPMKEFKKQGIKPYVGMKLNLEGHEGKVLTISGGRVKTDFNHDLAGKNLEYDIVISEIIENDEEKIKSMVELHYAYPKMDLDKTEIKIDGDNVSIKLDEITKYDQKSHMEITFAKYKIARDLWDNTDFEKVKFVEEFIKEEEKVEEESSEDLSIEESEN
ncbi:MAG: peptidylprolyl isomerase [Methanobrevibacter sp.]|nr:peptidylprolyl isomerase [Methanobrevibacter sp.]